MKKIVLILAFLSGSPAWATTYYVRADGSAANKAAATSCSAAGTAMSVATHNTQTYSADDVITVCDSGGVYRGTTLIPQSSGTSGHPITYINSGSPVLNGSSLITGWTATPAEESCTGTCLFANGFEFESNSFTNFWTGKTTLGSNTVTVQGTTFDQGLKAAKMTWDGTNWNSAAYKTLSPGQTTIYARAYVYIPSTWAYTAPGTYSGVCIMCVYDSANSKYLAQLFLRVGGSAGSYSWYVHTNMGAGADIYVGSDGGLTTNAWHYVELKVVSGSATVSGVSISVDGSSLGSNFALNASGNSATTLYIGEPGGAAYGSKPTSAASMFFDSVKIATTGPIGTFTNGYAANTYYAPSVTTAPNVVWLDNTVGTNEATKFLAAANNEWNYDALNNLWINSTSAPSGRTIEAGALTNTIYVGGKNYVTIDGIAGTKANGTYAGVMEIDGNSVQATGSVIQNSTITNFTSAGITLESTVNASLLNNTITGVGDDSNGISVSTINGAAAASNPTITGNTITHTHFGIFSPVSVITGNATGGTISKNTIHEITWEPISLSYWTSPTISQNLLYNVAADGDITGIHVTFAPGSQLLNNRIHDVTYTGSTTSFGACIQLDQGSDNSLAQGNICYHSDAGYVTTQSATVKWYGNTGYDIGHALYAGGVCSGFYIQGTLTSGIWKNNLIYDTSTGNQLYIWNFPTTGLFGPVNLANVSLDNNLEYKSSGNWYNIQGATGASLSTWNGESFSGGHDIFNNPLFANAGSADFSLQAISPAIGKGTNLGPPYALGLGAGSTWPSGVILAPQAPAWNIGAYVTPGGINPFWFAIP